MSVHWGGPGAGHVSRWSVATTGVPVLSLNFLTSNTLDPRVTFTRSTTATFVGSTGLIQTAAINAPRFDFNPVTLACRGLLIEESRTNTLTYSDDFSNAAWIPVAVTISADATTSPDGTTNADKLVENATLGEHKVYRGFGATIGTAYTWSVFAKKGERNWIYLDTADGVDIYTFFDLDNGVVGNVGAGVTAKIENYGNGWYRCTASKVAATAILYFQFGLATSNGVFNYTGDGTSGAFFYGAQFEAGAFATSYIPTVASTVARTADIAVMTGTNFSSWYNASEGTFVSSFGASPNAFTTYVAASNGVVAQNSIHMDNDGGNMRAAYYSGSSAVALLSLGAVGTLNVVNKVATAYKVNDFAASRNGGAVVTDTAGAVPVGVVQLNIGADPSGAAVNVSNTHIRSITYYPSRLTNAQLQALTT